MIRFSLKDGVSLHGLTPEMAASLYPIARVYKSLSYNFVITSANDGKHMDGSKHPQGDAIDTRIWDVPNKDAQIKLVAALAEALGPDFDVILESDHIHIERDPK